MLPYYFPLHCQAFLLGASVNEDLSLWLKVCSVLDIKDSLWLHNKAEENDMKLSSAESRSVVHLDQDCLF